MGWVCVEGCLLVETGRGGVGVRTYWCVATSHALNTCEVVDSMDGQCGRSAAAEFELGKLVSKMHLVRDMVHACTDLVYINPTPSSISSGTPPPTS